MLDPLALRVAARWLKADQPPGQRDHARKLTQPINKPKGIKRQIQKDHGRTEDKGDEKVKPDRRDIQPKDVFSPTPKDTGVLNLVETGKDLSQPLDKQVPKDKGYETVKNLSQYLIRTEGGGEGGPEGKEP